MSEGEYEDSHNNIGQIEAHDSVHHGFIGIYIYIYIYEREPTQYKDMKAIVFIRPKDSIMASEQTILLCSIELKLFLGYSHLLKNEMTNNLYVCHSVIV